MDHPTWIGRTLSGRYRIDDVLGQGGMSAVYKAIDPNLKRVVAIKLIHSHLSTDPSFVKRFESEAAAVASLRHQNIVQVYDFNNDNGVYYMVLEFVPGETLQDRMKRLSESGRQLPLEDALKYTQNISDAVGYAHQRGMVHRDIKPANIMLDMQGQAILMDFGIVKILGGEGHTSTGAVVGTARYMSPEIIRGEVADHRSDIYSLGVTLFEMLSGRPPFVADSAMTLMMMHLNDPVPSVRDFRGDIPAEIVAIVEKCLVKDQNTRYQPASELSADLRRAIGHLADRSTSTMVNVRAPVLETSVVSPRVDDKNVPTTLEPAPAPQSWSQPVVQSPPPATTPPSSSKRPNRMIWLAAGGIALMLCLIVGFVVTRGFANRMAAPQSTVTNEPVATKVQATEPVVVIPTQEATSTLPPTETPTETPIPPTATPETPYVVITNIRLENTTYVVDYEVHNFPESPQLHVHMFFNTVPPEQAGSPGSGPWKLTWGPYGDPPFTQYGVANRPAGATQMCALVANPNHSVQPNSGNCFDLP